MRRSAPIVLATLLLSASAVHAQEDDAPIPYGDEGPATDRNGLRQLDHADDEDSDARWQDEDESERSLLHLDDPSIGISGALVGGMLFVDRPHAGAWTPRLGMGARFTWQFGRLWTDDLLRDGLFADVTWLYGTTREGTETFFVDEHQHYFTVAPAWQLLLDRPKTLGVYAQLGAGFTYLTSRGQYGTFESRIAGVKPALQYGVGLRWHPRLGGADGIRPSFRVEAIRFRRGYLDDTLFAASAGAAF